jgi:hypothetical protein
MRKKGKDYIAEGCKLTPREPSTTPTSCVRMKPRRSFLQLHYMDRSVPREYLSFNNGAEPPFAMAGATTGEWHAAVSDTPYRSLIILMNPRLWIALGFCGGATKKQMPDNEQKIV